MSLAILIDHDGCPRQATEFFLKQATRHQLEMIFVANRMPWIKLPASVRFQVVSGQLDAADDWIVDNCTEHQIVVTSDIPLADRVVKKGGRVLTYSGLIIDHNNIGERRAMRDLHTELRAAGQMPVSRGTPPSFDLSQFARGWDLVLHSSRK